MINTPITFIVIIISIINYFRIRSYTNTSGYDEALIKCGALVNNKNEIWRLLTAGFVHMSPSHLIMNIYCMYSLGTSLEEYLGPIYFSILLFGSMILGNIFSYCFSKDTYTISGGLSGGIYGLMLFYLKIIYSYYGLAAILTDYSLMVSIIINLSFNFMPGVGWKAHLGGALFGVLFAVILFL